MLCRTVSTGSPLVGRARDPRAGRRAGAPVRDGDDASSEGRGRAAFAANARCAFTLTELLVVIAILSLLIAIIFPVFASVRARGRQIACLSNLRQIGGATLMYASDYDGLYPYAKDASDYWVSAIWASSPSVCQAKIRSMPFLSPTDRPYLGEGVLGAYVRNRDVWHCPGDTGFDYLDNNDSCGGPCPMDARPTMYEKYGASYLYRTEIGLRQMDVDSIVATDDLTGASVGSSGILFLFDGNGSWHGGPFSAFTRAGLRYNGLFADGHAKLLTDADYERAWLAKLGPQAPVNLCP